MFFLSRKNYPHQYGFKKAVSTTAQLIEAIRDFYLSLEARQQIDVICVDFAKAFDKVPHTKLIFKFQQLSLTTDLLNWIAAYLKNRQQNVRVGDCTSSSLKLLSSVPWRSFLCPLQFSLL